VTFGGVASTRRMREGVAELCPWMSVATTRQRCSPSATTPGTVTPVEVVCATSLLSISTL
jgi:hypothetical protein